MSPNESNEYWEQLLRNEGLGNIDEEVKKVKSELDKILENSFSVEEIIDFLRVNENIEVVINPDLHEITLYDINENVIGYIKPGHYSYNGVDSPYHLEKKVYEEYRGRGFGKVLFTLYEKSGFKTPKIEYSHDLGSIRLLLSYGYTNIYRMENGESMELENYEIDELLSESEIPEYITYKLVRVK